jgi:hypothetical protein
MALVALDPDRIEHIGSGFERNYKLALSGGRIDGRLWQREPVRTGAQQPVVDNSGDFTCQWSGDGGIPRYVCRQSFYWSGN